MRRSGLVALDSFILVLYIRLTQSSKWRQALGPASTVFTPNIYSRAGYMWTSVFLEPKMATVCGLKPGHTELGESLCFRMHSFAVLTVEPSLSAHKPFWLLCWKVIGRRMVARQPCWDSSGDKGQAKHPTAVRLTGLDSTDYLIRKLFSAQTQLNSHQNESPKLFLRRKTEVFICKVWPLWVILFPVTSPFRTCEKKNWIFYCCLWFQL